MGSRSPTGKGQFEGEWAVHCKVQGIPSMCVGDAAFCQITLTTCLFIIHRDTSLIKTGSWWQTCHILVQWRRKLIASGPPALSSNQRITNITIPCKCVNVPVSLSVSVYYVFVHLTSSFSVHSPFSSAIHNSTPSLHSWLPFLSQMIPTVDSVPCSKLTPWTITRTVSSKQISFCFLFFSLFFCSGFDPFHR